MNECRVRINDISVNYRKESVLSNVSFHLDDGKVYGLFSKNGIGKTTLLKVLAGVFEVDKDEVVYKENTHIGYSIEDSLIVNGLNVNENLAYYAKLNGINSNAKKIDDIFELTGISEFRNKCAKLISKGMRQRVSLAIAMIADPNLLILDEAISGIDVISRRKISTYFRDLAKKDTCVVFADHDVANILNACDEIIFLKNNSNVEVIAIQKLLGGNTDVSIEEAEKILVDILEDRK